MSGKNLPNSNIPGPRNDFGTLQDVGNFIMPSANMFPTQQPSPNKNQHGNPRNAFSQRAFERGPISANPTNIGQNRPFGAHNMSNFHGMFGDSFNMQGHPGGYLLDNTQAHHPPFLNMSEFPSLTGRSNAGMPMPHPNAAPGNRPYVGMLKPPTAEPVEFTMSKEDFPALPGTLSGAGTSANGDSAKIDGSGSNSGLGGLDGENASGTSNEKQTGDAITAIGQKVAPKRPDILTTTDGRILNMPDNLVSDQFGMAGLLTFIRLAEVDKEITSLAMGQDLTILGLNLNNPESLMPKFAGPLATHNLGVFNHPSTVTPCYQVNHKISNKLPPVRLARYTDEVLLFFFHGFPNEIMQAVSAHELYTRDWRWMIEEKLWLKVKPVTSFEKTPLFERGMFTVFDHNAWRSVTKEMSVVFAKLEAKPTLPPWAMSFVMPVPPSVPAPATTPASSSASTPTPVAP